LKSKTLVSYLIITLACAIYAVGFNWCFDPNHLSVGGVTGIAQIIHFFVPQLPVGVMTIAMNAPLFILGWRKIGPKLLFGSLYATAVSSAFIDLLAMVHTFQPMDSILAVLYGGVLLGAAFGIMLMQSATTGGTELAARLLKLRFERIPIGKICLVIDTTVTIVYAIIFHDMSRALYGIVGLYVVSIVMDKVIYGGNAAKVAYIISEQHQIVTERLLQLNRGVTLLNGTGAYSGADKKVILCAFSRSQIVQVKRLVKEADPDAFIIVYDAHEILGEGFSAYTPGGL